MELTWKLAAGFLLGSKRKCPVSRCVPAVGKDSVSSLFAVWVSPSVSKCLRLSLSLSPRWLSWTDRTIRVGSAGSANHRRWEQPSCSRYCFDCCILGNVVLQSPLAFSCHQLIITPSSPPLSAADWCWLPCQRAVPDPTLSGPVLTEPVPPEPMQQLQVLTGLCLPADVQLPGPGDGGSAGLQRSAPADRVLWRGSGGSRPAVPGPSGPSGRLQPLLPGHVHPGHEGGAPARGRTKLFTPWKHSDSDGTG